MVRRSRTPGFLRSALDISAFVVGASLLGGCAQDTDEPEPREGSGDAAVTADATLDVPMVDAAPGTDAAPVDAGAGTPVRFALEISNDVAESIWVQLHAGSSEPAWVVIKQGERRLQLYGSCLPGCEKSKRLKCGPSDPAAVRDITGGSSTGRIELLWNGLEIVDDPVANCVRAEPAAPGDYVATFCYAFAAELDENAEPVGGDRIPGEVIDPNCVDVPFRHPEDSEVVYQLMGG